MLSMGRDGPAAASAASRDRVLVQALRPASRPARRREARTGAEDDRAEDDSRLGTTVRPRARTAAADREHREVERAAAAQLPVDGRPPVGRRDADLRQQLVGLLGRGSGCRRRGRAPRSRPRARPRRTRGAAVAPSAIRTGTESADCTARHLRRRRRHPADRPVLLHAEVDRLPPLVVLVVVVAARVEQQVAAERAHVAQRRRRDLRDRVDEARMGPPDAAMVLDLRKRNARADQSVSSAPGAQPPQGADAQRPMTTFGVCWRRFMFG